MESAFPGNTDLEIFNPEIDPCPVCRVRGCPQAESAIRTTLSMLDPLKRIALLHRDQCSQCGRWEKRLSGYCGCCKVKSPNLEEKCDT